jgi:hypothetical protein
MNKAMASLLVITLIVTALASFLLGTNRQLAARLEEANDRILNLEICTR